MNKMGRDIIADDPNSEYLSKSGLVADDVPKDNNWYDLKIGNNQETKAAFEESMEPGGAYEAQLEKDGWNDADIQTHFEKEKAKYNIRNEISYTYHNPKKGGAGVKESYNDDYDFHRAKKNGKTTINGQERIYTRPAINVDQQVYNTDMFVDGWMVACKRDGVDPRSLSRIGLDNVETPEMREVYKKISAGQPGTKEVRAGPELDAFLASQQGTRYARMLVQNSDPSLLGPKKIVGYDLTFTKANQGFPTDRWDSVLILE